MEKIKNLLNPGHNKDDEIMYGSGDNSASKASGEGSQFTEPLHSKPEATKEHGIARQIFNPRGDKHDDVRYGSTATTDPNTTSQGSSTTPAFSSGTTTTTTTSSTGPTTTASSSQPTTGTSGSHLGRDAAVAGGTGALAGEGAKEYAHREKPAQGTSSATHPTSTSTSQSNHPTSSTGTTGSSTYTNPTTAQTSGLQSSQPDQHHYGRDAALAGGAAGAAGLGAHEYNKHDNSTTAGQQDTSRPGVSDPTIGSTVDPAGTSDRSHAGRDTALAGAGTGAAGLAAHEHNKNDKHAITGQQNLGPSSSSGIGSTTNPTHTGSANPTSTSDRSHLGRDAALGGAGVGAAGIAAREAGQRHNDQTATTSHNSIDNLGQSGSRYAPGTATSTGGYGQTAPTNASSTSGGNHLGRDAAIGGAGLGAAGLAAHEAGRGNTSNTRDASGTAGTYRDSPLSSHEHNGHGHQYTGDPCPPGDGPGSGPTFTRGPHTTDTANRLDPHVPGEFPSDDGYDRHSHGHGHAGRDAAVAGGVGAAGLGTHEAHKHHDQRDVPGSNVTGTQSSSIPSNTSAPNTSTSSTQQPQHHYGRDVALAGGAGAAGLGAHEAHKHHDQRDVPGSGIAGQQGSSLPTSTAQPSTSTSTATQPQHHYGRDAGLAGGAGAAGLGAYEANKHHNQQAPAGTSTTTPQTSGLSSTSQNAPSTLGSGQPQHHYGRDAALAGGAGAAGLGAHEANKHHNQHAPTSGVDSTQSRDPALSGGAGPTNLGAFDFENDRGNSSLGSGHTGSHRPLTSSYDDQRAEDPTTHHHHLGRDAAAAGGAGALGAGAYEAEKRHNQPTSSTSSGGFHSGPTGTAVSQPQTSSTQPSAGHHYGRDAAAVGGAGALGAGAYEADKHHRHQDDRSALPGSGTTSAVPSSRTADQPTQSQHHYGRDAAATGGVGALGAGAYEADKHHRHADDRSAPQTSNTSSNVPSSRTAEQPTQQQHHYGRDAAAAGGVGALGAGAYEADKHHRHADDRSVPQTSGTSSTVPSSRTAEQPGQQHHYGRDAAVAGGAAGAGAGAYELYNHNRAGATETDPASKTVGPHSSNVANVVDPRVKPDPSKQKDKTTAGPHQSDMLNRADPRVDSDLSKQQQNQAQNQHHYGRDAAVAGGGAAAVGGAAYELDKHEQAEHEKHEKERQKEAEKAEKQHQKDLKAEEKEHKKEIKAEEKEHKKEVKAEEKHQQKQHEKEAAAAAAVAEKEHKKHEKEEEKAEKKHAKEAEKAEKQHEKEAEKEEKKHHGILGFLHRNKDNKDQDVAADDAHNKHKHEGEAALAGAGVAGAGAAAYEGDRSRNHPSGSTHQPLSSQTQPGTSTTGSSTHPGRDAAAAGGLAGAGTGAGASSLRRDYEEEGATQPSSIATNPERSAHTGSGIGGTPYESTQPTSRSGTEPTSEHHLGRDAAVGTGGAAAAGTAAHEADKHHHNKLHKDPPPKVQRELEEKAGIVHDPHTGLPMNVGKYGSGAGGTDGSSNIPGYHGQP